MTALVRQAGVALRLLLGMTLLLGIVYPVAIWAIGRLVPVPADGSFVTDSAGRVVGSSLIAQAFDDPSWFHPRPSAAGTGYDAMSSGGSNLALDNPDLIDTIRGRKAAVVAGDRVAAASVPPDAVTASGSGLDPDISPAYAQLQVARVARARHLSLTVVADLVDQHTTGRILGFIGEPRVNVLELNLALERMS